MQQTAHSSYIVSFMPGARGRLIANIIYKLANNESTPIVFTEHNSAHTEIDNWDMKYVNSVTEMPNNPNKVSVLFTHQYPEWKREPSVGIICIKVPNSKLTEICLNAVIKNVIAKIEHQKEDGALSENQNSFIKKYAYLLPDNYLDLITNENFTWDFLHSVNKVVVPKFMYVHRKFIDNTSTDTNVFYIDYDKMFQQENGRYVILKRLTEYMGLDYNNDIHSIYEQYDSDKFNIFEKYCPWFNVTEK